ncbi:class I adenylate cyclase [Gynuella sp.]|uniref:class I adenylate cyclase n=1 Tax=Gynuella sp. TaxID=2969146 RepID=UPI003D124D89
MQAYNIVKKIADGGLDYPSMTELGKRFRAVNEGRLERLRSGMQNTQQQFLELLPMLFHVNHHMLPGWIEDDVPKGVSFYYPDRAVLSSLGQISRSYRYKQPNQLNSDISSIFLMGSTGTIGQSSQSDLDIWICHVAGLSAEKIYLLEQKAELISEWAMGMNLEVHFFVMDAHAFKVGSKGRLTSENAGSTQHYLLLDEFYRSHILIAGAEPAWWLVPPYEEHLYNQHVRHNIDSGFLNYGAIIDFGGVPRIPVDEFVGAGMWHLYKGIDAPYKSLLKLMLLELYAFSFPKAQCLCLDFKQAVYDFKLNLDELDPYVMLYRRLERYLLSRKQTVRLELVRRAFYFKIGISLSRKSRSPSWRRILIDRLAIEWGWTAEHIAHLDNKEQWGIDDVIREQKVLIAELTHSYRFLTQIAQKIKAASKLRKQEMLILGRKLSAAFDRKPGKIEIINSTVSADLSREKLTVHQLQSEHPEQSLWGAYCNQLTRMGSHPPQPLKHSSSLIEVMIWSYFNGLLDAHINIPVFTLLEDDSITLTDYELKEIINSFRYHFHKPLKAVPQEAFVYKSCLVKTILYVNVARDPMAHLSARGLQKISNRTDSLDFSSLRENLVQTLDLVVLNSWNEVHVSRFDLHDDTLVQCLLFLLNSIATSGSKQMPEFEALCFSVTRPAAIANRVQQLFRDVMRYFFLDHQNVPGRYVFGYEDKISVISFDRNKFTSIQVDTQQEFIEMLTQERLEFAPIRLDRYALAENRELRMILSNSYLRGIQVYFRRLSGQRAKIYVVDEYGSLFSYQVPFLNVRTLIKPLYRFLRIIEYRKNTDGDSEAPLVQEIFFYEYLENTQDRTARLIRRRTESDITDSDFYNIRALVRKEHDGNIHYTVLVGEREFDSLTLGQQFYVTVAKALSEMNQLHETQVCYVTDLELADEIKADLPFGRAQTIHYFQYKYRLESRINSVLKGL